MVAVPRSSRRVAVNRPLNGIEGVSRLRHQNVPRTSSFRVISASRLNPGSRSVVGAGDNKIGHAVEVFSVAADSGGNEQWLRSS
jgi:hypothetical protein